jgi:hypothetical protein
MAFANDGATINMRRTISANSIGKTMPKPKPKAKRVVMRVELTGPAKQKLDEVTDLTGMTQIQVMSRMIEWFTGQSELIQANVLGRYPVEIQDEVARLILRRMYPNDDAAEGSMSDERRARQ